MVGARHLEGWCMRQVLRRGWGFVGLAALLTLAGCGAPSAFAGPTQTAVQVMLPTATPIATPSDPAGQQLLRTARGAVGSAAQSVGVTYDVATKNLAVTIIITGIVPDSDARVAAAWERAKTLSFQELNGLWSSGLPLRQVTVYVLGPAQDEYDTIYPQAYSVAIVSAATARRIPWPNATPDSAWRLYDLTFLRPSFTVADDIPPVPTAPPSQGG
jgi:hypothetical protein